MPATRIKRFLDENDVSYTRIEHEVAYTAQETAALAHIPGREVAKTVMVRIDGVLAMAILPATNRLSKERLKGVAHAREVTMASEQDFKDMFPDCELGAMPPLGNLYDLKVYVDKSLAADEQIAFNAGTHAELIQISYHDFERLVRPVIAHLTYDRSVPV
jgi:Ala-tRNA(Pro) deacylase